MDHGGHHMPTPDSPHRSLPCTMNMVFNLDPVGICLVFESLQIKSKSQVVPYLLLVTFISILCEWIRLSLQSFDRQLRSQYRGGAFQPSSIPPLPSSSSSVSGPSGTPRVGLGLNTPGGRRVGMNDGSEEGLMLRGGRVFGTVRLPWSIQTRRSLYYVVHVALTFYIMLLVMSYNLQIIASILLGAFVGHFTFQRNFDLGGGGDELDGKGINCH
ncbi:copper transporter family protein [Sporobolomyces salmoneus]|uniref:copper transporter family protein n=1 Tax=Sporobolomyces salmoneus TaxID=183962 RepID=UPI00317582D4